MPTHPTALAVAAQPLPPGQVFHFVFSNKTKHDDICLVVLSLKHENEMLKRKVDVLEKMLQIKSNGHVSITTSESEDEKELEKEEVSLD